MQARLTDFGLVAPLDLEDLKRATRGFSAPDDDATEDLLRRHTIDVPPENQTTASERPPML